ncbi:zf-TFIIB domain-containing protein [bacterium]|nr:zf-TFIIB domain-containing protein [bacterium]
MKLRKKVNKNKDEDIKQNIQENINNISTDDSSTDVDVNFRRSSFTAEDSYFAEKDRERIERVKKEKELKEENKKEQEAKIRMCPDCKTEELKIVKLHNFSVAKCKKCGGMWLKETTFKAIMKTEANVITKFMSMFGGKKE